MSEYLKRHAGGFYIVEEVDGAKLLSVRRAVNQVIDPNTGHPFPEDTFEDRYLEHLQNQRSLTDLFHRQYEGTFTNCVAPEADLTQESLERTLETLHGYWQDTRT